MVKFTFLLTLLFSLSALADVEVCQTAEETFYNPAKHQLSKTLEVGLNRHGQKTNSSIKCQNCCYGKEKNNSPLVSLHGFRYAECYQRDGKPSFRPFKVGVNSDGKVCWLMLSRESFDSPESISFGLGEEESRDGINSESGRKHGVGAPGDRHRGPRNPKGNRAQER